MNGRFWLEKTKPGRYTGGCTFLHFDKEWKMEKIGFNDDELDELRRIIGVGMGDCDHCPAWKPYIESTKVAAQKDAEVISHDMKRLCEHELWLKRHSISLEQLRDQQDIHTAGITALGNKINGCASNATHHIKRHDGELEMVSEGVVKLIKELGELQKEVEVLKLALVTVNHRAEEDRGRGQSKLKSTK